MPSILGLAELDANLQKLARQVDEPEFIDGLMGIAVIFRNKLKANTPVLKYRKTKRKIKLSNMIVGEETVKLSGDLKKSWKAKRFKTKSKGNPAVFVAIDRKFGPHGHLVEFGHGGPHSAPPHSFVRPVVDAFKNEFPLKVAVMLREKFGK